MITIILLRQCKAKLFFGLAIAEPKKLSRADFLSRPGELFLVHSTNENPQTHDNSQFVIVFFLVLHVLGLASDLRRHVSRYSVSRLAKGLRKTVLSAGTKNGFAQVDLCN